MLFDMLYEFIDDIATDMKYQKAIDDAEKAIADCERHQESECLERIKEKRAHFFAGIGQFREDMDECVDDFMEKVTEKYEGEEIFEPGTLPGVECRRGSGTYPTKAKAKLACKEAVRSMTEAAGESYRKERDAIAGRCRAFLKRIEEDISSFGGTFQESFRDYLSIDIEDGEEQKALMEAGKELVSGEKLQGFCVQTGMMEKLDALLKELFDAPLVKALDTAEYFAMCTYEEDGDGYCYEAEEAEESLQDELQGIYDDACENLAEEVERLWRAAIGDYGGRLTTGLEKVLQAAFRSFGEGGRN